MAFSDNNSDEAPIMEFLIEKVENFKEKRENAAFFSFSHNVCKGLLCSC